MTSATDEAEKYAIKRWGDEPQYQDARARDEAAFLSGHKAALESAEVTGLVEALERSRIELSKVRARLQAMHSDESLTVQDLRCDSLVCASKIGLELDQDNPWGIKSALKAFRERFGGE